MKSSLASSRENWVLLIPSSFLMVLFMAPEMPELHWDPKPIAVTKAMDANFQVQGT